jgi:hypothetical protein
MLAAWYETAAPGFDEWNLVIESLSPEYWERRLSHSFPGPDFSPWDDRVVVASVGYLSVVDIRGGAELQRLRLPPKANMSTLQFLEPHRLRILRHARCPPDCPERLEIFQSAPAAAAFELCGSARSPLGAGSRFGAWRIGQSREHDRLLLIWRDHAAEALALHDGTTGATIAVLDSWNGWTQFEPLYGFLDDGTVYDASCATGLRLYSAADGVLLRRLKLPECGSIRIVGEVARGKLLAFLVTGMDERVVLIDLGGGAILGDVHGLRPAADVSGWYRAPVVPGSLATRLFFETISPAEPPGALVEMDLELGTSRTILPGGR